MNKKIPFLIGLIAILFLAGIVVLTLNMQEKEQIINDEVIVEKKVGIKSTEWKEYILEEITGDFESIDFMDRKLVGIKEDGTKETIVSSVRDLMDWEKTPGEGGYYPVEISFPPYSSKIFFVKYMAGTGHSFGSFMLDANTLEVEELNNISPIYENYYNYQSTISPDGLKIASYGYDKLYLLDLLKNEAILLAEAEEGEVFYFGQSFQYNKSFEWVDNETIKYPIYFLEDIHEPWFLPIEIRKISVETMKIEILSSLKNLEYQQGKDYSEHVGSIELCYEFDRNNFFMLQIDCDKEYKSNYYDSGIFHKKEIIPMIKLDNEDVREKIQELFEYLKIMNKDNVMGDEKYFEVNYDKNNILSLTTVLTGVGAYPYYRVDYYNINLLNGETIKPDDIFYKEKTKDLIAILGGIRQEREKAVDYVSNNPFDEKILEKFIIKEDGIKFIVEYNFPHVIRATEPDGKIFLKYEELKDYISKEGLLSEKVK